MIIPLRHLAVITAISLTLWLIILKFTLVLLGAL